MELEGSILFLVLSLSFSVWVGETMETYLLPFWNGSCSILKIKAGGKKK